MADRNTYLRYKRDQRLLVYWIANTSNNIIRTRAPATPLTINTTGEVSLATLKSLSELIAAHIKPVPHTIFRLFQSIIKARNETHHLFLRIFASDPDPDIQKNNESHKHWIDGLTDAFNALGGEAWLSEKRDHSNALDEDEEEVIFANKFSTLSVDGGKEQEDEDEDEDDSEDAKPATARSRKTKKKPAKNGKKGKRARKPRGKTKSAPPTQTINEIPLESYRIIEDGTILVTDYLMAVYSFAFQWIGLRHYLQSIWREVAYEGLNGAVAATVSKIAVNMIRDTESQIFVDFPGHESFETIMRTITRGDPDWAQGGIGVEILRTSPEGGITSAGAADLDVREELLVHCYDDLVEFITDFQKTRSGKPTKNMSKRIQNWDPTFDLQGATEEQRLKWRRDYTINWLYDLVNVFSLPLVQHRVLKGQDIPLESVDWSVNGPWNGYRRLFGLNEFAGEVTHFAVQKPGTDVRQKILPHHVFQLQCIVDSLTVSRGWSIHTLTGHRMGCPASGFRPRRDVDQFVDRQNENVGAGYLLAADVLSECFEKDAMLHGDPRRHEEINLVLGAARDDFRNWLGETKYMHGVKIIPPSRFSHVNANGLWEYSPYLCGAGLMEALELAYATGLMLWDRVHEPMCLIHLHNMLVQRGYISKPVSLYACIEGSFRTSFFIDGKVPTSKFDQAFYARIFPSKSWEQDCKLWKRTVRKATDWHEILNSNANRFFQTKSFLRLYRTAGWVPDRIPDEDIPTPSALAYFRIARAKVIDRDSGRVTLRDSDLVRRTRAMGLDDDTLLLLAPSKSVGMEGQLIDPRTQEFFKINASEGHHTELNPSRDQSKLDTIDQLQAFRTDIADEIYGLRNPIAAINYVAVLASFMILFSQIEDELKRRRNPAWVQAYEGDSEMTRDKRLSLTIIALEGLDEECLKVMAEQFENFAIMKHVYWANFENTYEEKSHEDDDVLEPDYCSVM